MEGSVLPIAVAHGEGRAVFEDSKVMDKSITDGLVPVQFVDSSHQVTTAYPLNPNGSDEGIAALSSADGRALIMMPHPERVFLSYQNSWHPKDWPYAGPWLRMFQNARQWTENN